MRVATTAPWQVIGLPSSRRGHAGARTVRPMSRLRLLILFAVLAVLPVLAAAATAAAPQTRIVGGAPVAIAEMPWIVYLETDVGRNDSWSCGGTIVGPHFVLTAAHCVIDKGAVIRPSQLTGVAGRADLRGSDGTQFAVTRIVVHPGYNRSRGVEGGPNDAALLWTDVDLPYPVLPLATTADAAAYAAGVSARIAGWGLTSGTGSGSDLLLSATVPIVSDAECASRAQVSLAEAQAMVCAGYVEGGIDTCQGDSGGPLTVVSGAGATILAGIVSWGYECAAANRPGLYTRVALLTGWLTPLLAGDEAAWAAAADQTTPRVRLSRAVMAANERVRFSYRILGETGPTRETITVRRTRGGTVLKRLVTKATVKSASTTNSLVWQVPARLPYGAYVWCLTSRDTLGNTSTLQCAPFIV